MISKISTKIGALVLALAPFLSISISSANDLLSTGSRLERAGLMDEWFTQVEVGARSSIVNIEIQVNEDKTTRYYLVEYGNVVERISQFDLDAFGKERGIEGAQQFASVRKEIIEAELAAQKRTDVKVKIRPISLPQTTIFVATSTGKTTAIDADTGKHLWQNSIGNPRYKTSGVGASRDYVAVVNGSTVYCMTADEGRLLWSKECGRSPSAAPSVGANNIYVPLINGRLEVFAIDETSLPRSFVSFGNSVAKPLLTDLTVSWATRDGFYAVAPYNAQTIQFRLNSGSQFAAGGTARNGSIYVCTTGGSVFSLDEKDGAINWEYSTGDRITSRPFLKDDSLFVVSAENRLFKFDTKLGRPAEGWGKPIEGISRFVTSSRDRIYALDFVGRIIAIDPATGAKIASVPSSEFSLVVRNPITDRLYVGSEKGLIRCIREIGNTYPIFHANDAEKIADVNKSEAIETPAEESSQEDPFAGSEDPFAAESDPFGAAASDPFADDSEPAEPEETTSDPFAAGDDSTSNDDSGDDEEDPFAPAEDSSDDSGDSNDPFGSDDDDEDPFGDTSDDDDEDPFGG